jgi:hypothetical protein
LLSLRQRQLHQQTTLPSIFSQPLSSGRLPDPPAILLVSLRVAMRARVEAVTSALGRTSLGGACRRTTLIVTSVARRLAQRMCPAWALARLPFLTSRGSRGSLPTYSTPSKSKGGSVVGASHGLTGFSMRELRMMFKHFMSDQTSMRIFIFLTINFLFMFVELAYGFYSNSLGLISDAGHMLVRTHRMKNKANAGRGLSPLFLSPLLPLSLPLFSAFISPDSGSSSCTVGFQGLRDSTRFFLLHLFHILPFHLRFPLCVILRPLFPLSAHVAFVRV